MSTNWIKISDWNRYKGNFRPGDLVEFDSKAYKHWAVYMDKDLVVHVTKRPSIIQTVVPVVRAAVISAVFRSIFPPTCPQPNYQVNPVDPWVYNSNELVCQDLKIVASPKNLGSGCYVAVDDIANPAADRPFRVNNDKHHFSGASFRSLHEIFKRVLKHQNKSWEYSAGTGNCEHFATQLKYSDEDVGEAWRRCQGILFLAGVHDAFDSNDDHWLREDGSRYGYP